ncbi:MAG TPA: energy transducer TonB [Allosphingosinicella sp.]|jgi:protein TonB
MAEAGFLEAKRIRPGSAAAVILLHGAALAALLMAKGYVPTPRDFTETKIIDVAPPPPPPRPEPLPQPQRPTEQVTNYTTTPVPRPTPSPFQVPPAPPGPPPDLDSLAGNEEVRGVPDVPRADPVPDPPRPAPPVRVEPTLVSGDLQPPYPTSEQRAEREGTVVIRLTIGTNGRVVAAQKVRATSDAFYTATERHALGRWRFRPATLDGRPVEGRKTLTVHFRLDES